jgi:hypothetical protein
LWGGHAAAIYMRATPPVIGPAPELLRTRCHGYPPPPKSAQPSLGNTKTLLLPAARTPDDEILKDSCPRQ